MPNNFEGHQFNIVALSWYPITALEPLTSKPCTETIPKDSVDVRMVTEVSKLLNFRWENHSGMKFKKNIKTSYQKPSIF